MIRALFLDVRKGKLGRLAYLGYSLLLFAIAAGIVLGVVAYAFGAESIFEGGNRRLDDAFGDAFAGPSVILMFAILFVFLFADLNITAKRFRDIGLAGWLNTLALAGVTVAVYLLFFELGGDLFSLVARIILVLAPSRAVDRG